MLNFNPIMRLNRCAFLFLVFAGISIQSCQKRGCTNPNATNYSTDAKQDDGSCAFGAFSVKDSIEDPYNNGTFFHSQYTIEIIKAHKAKNTYYILNYANEKKFNGKPIKVICHIYENQLIIPEQTTLRDDSNNDYPDYLVSPFIFIQENTGYFSHDSLFINLRFYYEQKQYKGKCWGSR